MAFTKKTLTAAVLDGLDTRLQRFYNDSTRRGVAGVSELAALVGCSENWTRTYARTVMTNPRRVGSTFVFDHDDAVGFGDWLREQLGQQDKNEDEDEDELLDSYRAMHPDEYDDDDDDDD